MSEKDLAGLIEFGLTALQANAYVILLKVNAARASQVSSMLNVHRPEAYRLLRELSDKGLVQKNLGYPWTYSAVPPERALSVLMRRYKDRLIALDQERANLVSSLSQLIPIADLRNQEVSVKETVADGLIMELKEMLSRARRDYVGIHSKYGLQGWLDHNLARSIVRAKRRNLRIRLIAESDATNLRLINFLSRHIEVKLSKELLFYLDIVDRKEMLFGPVYPLTLEEARRVGQKDLDLSTSNTIFVRGMYGMFERLWETSTEHSP